MKDYGLSKTDAQILINQKSVSDFYDAAVSAYNAPKSIANFIIRGIAAPCKPGRGFYDSTPHLGSGICRTGENVGYRAGIEERCKEDPPSNDRKPERMQKQLQKNPVCLL